VLNSNNSKESCSGMGGELLPVFLSCSLDELVRGVGNVDRIKRRKIASEKGPHDFLAQVNYSPVPRAGCLKLHIPDRAKFWNFVAHSEIYRNETLRNFRPKYSFGLFHRNRHKAEVTPAAAYRLSPNPSRQPSLSSTEHLCPASG